MCHINAIFIPYIIIRPHIDAGNHGNRLEAFDTFKYTNNTKYFDGYKVVIATMTNTTSTYEINYATESYALN